MFDQKKLHKLKLGLVVILGTQFALFTFETSADSRSLSPCLPLKGKNNQYHLSSNSAIINESARSAAMILAYLRHKPSFEIDALLKGSDNTDNKSAKSGLAHKVDNSNLNWFFRAVQETASESELSHMRRINKTVPKWGGKNLKSLYDKVDPLTIGPGDDKPQAVTNAWAFGAMQAIYDSLTDNMVKTVLDWRTGLDQQIKKAQDERKLMIKRGNKIRAKALKRKINKLENDESKGQNKFKANMEPYRDDLKRAITIAKVLHDPKYHVSAEWQKLVTAERSERADEKKHLQKLIKNLPSDDRDAVASAVRDLETSPGSTEKLVKGISFIRKAKKIKDALLPNDHGDIGKLIDQLDDAANVYDQALKIGLAFGTGGAGGAIGGMEAFSNAIAVFSSFGGGLAKPDPNEQLNAALEKIDKKLDQIIELQIKTYDAILHISQQIEQGFEEVNSRFSFVDEALRTNKEFLKQIQLGYYSSCSSLLERAYVEPELSQMVSSVIRKKPNDSEILSSSVLVDNSPYCWNGGWNGFASFFKNNSNKESLRRCQTDGLALLSIGEVPMAFLYGSNVNFRKDDDKLFFAYFDQEYQPMWRLTEDVLPRLYSESDQLDQTNKYASFMQALVLAPGYLAEKKDITDFLKKTQRLYAPSSVIAFNYAQLMESPIYVPMLERVVDDLIFISSIRDFQIQGSEYAPVTDIKQILLRPDGKLTRHSKTEAASGRADLRAVLDLINVGIAQEVMLSGVLIANQLADIFDKFVVLSDEEQINLELKKSADGSTPLSEPEWEEWQIYKRALRLIANDPKRQIAFRDNLIRILIGKRIQESVQGKGIVKNSLAYKIALAWRYPEPMRAVLGNLPVRPTESKYNCGVLTWPDARSIESSSAPSDLNVCRPSWYLTFKCISCDPIPDCMETKNIKENDANYTFEYAKALLECSEKRNIPLPSYLSVENNKAYYSSRNFFKLIYLRGKVLTELVQFDLMNKLKNPRDRRLLHELIATIPQYFMSYPPVNSRNSE